MLNGLLTIHNYLPKSLLTEECYWGTVSAKRIEHICYGKSIGCLKPCWAKYIFLKKRFRKYEGSYVINKLTYEAVTLYW